jgi:phospholipid/cholesterol/gamma-HCH transport system permease protein
MVRALGAIGLLGAGAVGAVLRPRPGSRPLTRSVVRQASWMLAAGLPLVGLVHVALGSFLAMQAYYGATFVIATGPVVGLGLLRNLSPLVAGWVLAALLAVRTAPELRDPTRPGLDEEPGWAPDRDVARGLVADPRPPADPARLAAARVLAAMLAGPVLGLLGALVGLGVGIGVSGAMLGLPAPIFLDKFLEMFWARDVFGLAAKGVAFGGGSALLACSQGLRDRGEGDSWALSFRVACLSVAAILAMNMAWFLLAYHAGPPWGPTVLRPPSL